MKQLGLSRHISALGMRGMAFFSHSVPISTMVSRKALWLASASLLKRNTITHPSHHLQPSSSATNTFSSTLFEDNVHNQYTKSSALGFGSSRLNLQNICNYGTLRIGLFSLSSTSSLLSSPVVAVRGLTSGWYSLWRSIQQSTTPTRHETYHSSSSLISCPSILRHKSTFNDYSSILHKKQHFSPSPGRNVHTSSSSSSSISSSSNPQNSTRSSPPTRLEVVANQESLILYRGNESRLLPFMWLRDHCRCSACYNHETNQKASVTSPLEQELNITQVNLEDGNKNLVIRWKDEHVTKHSVDWLMKNSYCQKSNPIVARTPWDCDTIQSHGLPVVSFARHVETEEGLRQTLRNLLQYGFSFIDEAPVSLEGTQIATERLAPVQNTLFGGMWQFTSDGSHSDTAYDSGFLAAHTDNTYLEMPAGIQVFQCLKHDGQGGENMLVDGLHAVERLRQTHPVAVRCLSSHLVPHEYKEPLMESGSPGYHMYTLCPVIKLHPATGDMVYLRFNPYDRAPLNTIPPEHMAEFYKSYQLLSTTIADPKGQFWVKLKPGNIVLIDNWRVMHGRSSFTGQRIMCGCYLPRDEWRSKARMMGLAHCR